MPVFRNDLFVAADGSRMEFKLLCHNAEELKEHIEVGGGSVVTDSGPFTIELHDTAHCAVSNVWESFHHTFVILCCLRNKILPLKEFWCSSAGPFPTGFNPNLVLEHKMSRECAKLECLKATNHKSADPQVSSDDQNRRGSKTRCDFTQQERKDIVKYIVENECYGGLKGTAIWKTMSQQFSNHTWESLKGHFFNKILPLIKVFNLSPDALRRIREGTTKNRRGKNVSKSSFSEEETRLLKDYVAKNAGPCTALGGNVFWKQMEEKQAVTGRSWQALRQHYLKHIKTRAATKLVPKQNTTTTDSSATESDQEESVKVVQQSKKKRKLFTSSELCDTPMRNNVHFSPIPEERPEGQLDIIFSNNQLKLVNVKKRMNVFANNTTEHSKSKNLAVSNDENQTDKSVDEILKSSDEAILPTVDICRPGIAKNAAQSNGGSDGREHEDPGVSCQKSSRELEEHESTVTQNLSVFPSNTTSDCEDLAEDSDASDSWSFDGLFWRGECNWPSTLKHKKQPHPAVHMHRSFSDTEQDLSGDSETDQIPNKTLLKDIASDAEKFSKESQEENNTQSKTEFCSVMAQYNFKKSETKDASVQTDPILILPHSDLPQPILLYCQKHLVALEK